MSIKVAAWSLGRLEGIGKARAREEIVVNFIVVNVMF
jgi:hypothetical protein